MWVRMFKLVLLVVFLTVPTAAVDPTGGVGLLQELEWSTAGCQTGYECGELEFCQDGDTFAYRLAGDPLPCGDSAPPLIRITAGKNYKLLFKNLSGDPANLHPHGLHVSGAGNADDVVRTAGTTECLLYYWEIPLDHMGGTFWFHGHVHKLTQKHVAGGAYGMVIVEEPDPEVPEDPLGEVENVAGDTLGIEAWLQQSQEILLLAVKSGSKRFGNKVLNGPTFELNVGEWYRLRVVTADAAGKYMKLSIPSGCDAHAVAHDGVWRVGLIPQDPKDLYTLTGGSRVDLAFICDAASPQELLLNGKTVATFVMTTLPPDPLPSPFLPTPTDPEGLWEYKGGDAFRPFRLRNFTDGSNFPDGLPVNTYVITMTASQINGISWDPNSPDPTPLPDVFEYGYPQEWIIGGSNAHPYHIHIYHLQVQDGNCGDAHEAGQFYDTIQASGDCRVRFWTIGFGQKVYMHCHVLSHEDNGAITLAVVTEDTGGLDMPIQDTTDTASRACPASPTPPPALTAAPTPAPTACDLGQRNDPCTPGNGGECCNGACKRNGRCP